MNRPFPKLLHEVRACTVCGAADDNRNTFLASTVVLSLLPLSMIFGGVYALVWASKHPEFFEDSPRDQPAK